MPILASFDGELRELTPEEEADFLSRLPPPQIPDRISKLQAELYLYSTGQLAAVQALIASKLAAGDAGYDIYWRSASHFERNHLALAALAHEMGWSPKQLDDMFIDASALI